VSFAVSWSTPPPPELLPDTVTVALDETRMPLSIATSVYVFVALGETVFDPLRSTWTPSRYTVSASVVVQVSVDDCPELIVDGDAVSFALSVPLSSWSTALAGVVPAAPLGAVGILP
jgi:hypothetical protein